MIYRYKDNVTNNYFEISKLNNINECVDSIGSNVNFCEINYILSDIGNSLYQTNWAS